ncbi:DUF397 domain-containing protein [Streptomyces sp. HU2014]|uniref:DUF397 domain-containing protein n=1 Tax=Streptomyces sp. HU2014 TaxID=2939414 RepID=UPI00200DC2BB|nr:DUF397 domain-containing protein [Streptomyces sp. HU2014]UQI44607.1 DUF397 domain-containing protein [Streptomyces sp. HU2014]
MIEPNWHTSSYTRTDNCVEVADNNPAVILVRDSKNRGRATLRFESAPWASFVEHAKQFSA